MTPTKSGKFGLYGGAFVSKVEEVPFKIRDGIMRSVRFYPRTHISGANFGRSGKGLCYTVLFRAEQHTTHRWESTSHLDKGNLVCFTTDGWKKTIWWAIIQDRAPPLLRAGLLSVEFLQVFTICSSPQPCKYRTLAASQKGN